MSIRFLVSIIACREFGFVYCMLGTIAQISHTYFLIESISSLDGTYKAVQAIMLSVFISSSLLFFTAISDNKETENSKKIHFAVTLFTIIEILINVYYYSRHLIIDKIALEQSYQIFDFIFAVVISALIPITIKLYSSNIRALEWIESIEHDEKAFVSTDIISNESSDNKITKEDIESIIDEKINELKKQTLSINELEAFDVKKYTKELFDRNITSLMQNVDVEISQSFEKNQELFLKQFENKVKLLIQNKLGQPI